MPSDNCVGFYDHQDRFPVAPQAPNQTQKIRSAGVSLSRLGADLRKTPSCCRKARFSSRSSAEVFNIETRVPTTVSKTCRAALRRK